MTTTVRSAIDESIQSDSIVTIDATPEDIQDLICESDDSTDNGPVYEFWGTDEDGDTWRVHARQEAL